MTEQWRGIKNYENKYEVSNLGRVRSIERKSSPFDNNGTITVRRVKEIILKPGLFRGYKRVDLCKNGKHEILRVHRLVASAFISNPDNKPEVNHKNGAKDDNDTNNLEWCTRYENAHHAKENGLYNSERGESRYNSKLNREKVLQIRKKYMPQIYTMPMLSKEYGVTISCIQSVIERTSWNWTNDEYAMKELAKLGLIK